MTFLMPLLSWLYVFVVYLKAETLTEYPLYGIVPQSPNNMTEKDLKTIALNFNAIQGDFNSHSSQIIHESNPDFKIVYYRNSGHTFSNEIITTETDKTSILRYPFATLKKPLTSQATDNVVVIQLLEHFSSIPVKKSTIDKSSNYSKNCQDFISWIRIDTEYMKITNIADDSITVVRGFIGSVNNSNPIISSHNQNAKVFAPIYNGAAPGESNCDQLKYMVDIESEFAINSLVNATYQALQSHVDGSWYDLFSADPFHAVDGRGNELKVNNVWDDNKNDYFNCYNYINAQQNRLTAIYNELEKVYGYNPNNMNPTSYDDCNSGLLLQSNPPSFPYALDRIW